MIRVMEMAVMMRKGEKKGKSNNQICVSRAQCPFAGGNYPSS